MATRWCRSLVKCQTLKMPRAMELGASLTAQSTPPTADGNADRIMILSAQFFVSPSDTLAMIELGVHVLSWN